jgi:alanine racemase
VRPSRVEIDLAAIRHNVATIAAEVAPSRLCSVVKADGYGHGDVPVAEAAIAGGAAQLAVAIVEEGIRLREAGIEAPILLLSEPPVSDAADVVSWRLTPTAYTSEFVDALERTPGDDEIPVHVKLDTGMHRVGADEPVAVELAKRVAAARRLSLAAVWTHFAVAEEDAEYTGRQADALAGFRDRLAAAGIAVGSMHAANTAGALMSPATRFDMVRVGLGTYGLRPHPSAGAGLDLRPAMRVVSEVAHVRSLAAGERPSYGRRRPLPKASYVATVPIGYADGVSRRLSSVGGEVLIGGRRMPFAGTVTMDQIVVDVGDVPVSRGEEVVVLGAQGDEEISADEWAERLDTINYEIVCDFGPRLPRLYKGGSDE